MASVINEPIVVRLTVPVKNMPIGTELGYKDVADAIAALGSAAFFEVVRTQDGDPIPPLTPEEIEEAQRAAQRRAKSRRLILGADFDPLWERVDGIPSATELQQMRQGVQTVQGEVSRLSEAVGNIVVPEELPPIPGLFFHLDAQSITANDGSRVAAWTDRVSGTTQAVQATAERQPRYDVLGINGRPAVYFDTARNDMLSASTTGTSSLASTVFVVVNKPTFASGNRYFFGTNGSARNLYHRSNGEVGLQSILAFNAPATNDVPQIVTGVFNGASSALRVDGVSTSGNAGESVSTPGLFVIGHRTSGAAGAGFTGHIGEVLYYDRALTANECVAVERYLAAKWALTITPQTTWYVDSVLGSDTNTGRRPEASLRTLSRAVAGIKAAGATDATVVIHAPESNPIREVAAIHIDSGATVRMVSRTPGQKWHLSGAQRITSGWTHVGGGVYSRAVAIGTDAAPVALVPTLLDRDGQSTRIFTRNTATPTTPAAGEYGYTGGTYYLRLPGDANPNQHTVEIATAYNLLVSLTGSSLHLSDAALMGAQSKVALSTGGSSPARIMTATDSDAWFAGDSCWGTTGDNRGMTLTRCRGWYAANDGFNHHANAGNAAIMELIDCEGFWNSDEGVSPHDDTRLILRGGSFHHNGHGGLTSVQNAVTQLSGTEFYANRVYDTTLTGKDSGGVSILEQSRLISTNLYSHDHPGPGIEIETASGASWTDNGGTRSGTAHGNGAEDVT